jgi:membrane fusion protein (multidrug efflux system)
MRLLSTVVGLALIAGGALVVMNLTAEQASGAASDSSEPAAEESQEEKKAPVPVEVAAISNGEISSYISASANLVAEFEVRVLAEVEGRVATLQVEEGQAVRKGQQLATLVRDDQQILLRKAELRERNARADFERAEDLIDKELISREEHDRLTVEYEIARQELEEARSGLAKTIVRAPFDGRVTDRMVQVGQNVRPADELLQVTDFDPLIARIYLPERDVLGLGPGREVRIALNADESIRFGGRIRQISEVVDTATGTVKVTVEAENPPQGVRPGSFVSVHIVRETHEQAILVPREAVLRELQTAHVFVASEETAEKREVTLGLEEGLMVEAISGVEAGDRVIVAGQGGLKEGSPIKILGEPELTG